MNYNRKHIIEFLTLHKYFSLNDEDKYLLIEAEDFNVTLENVNEYTDLIFEMINFSFLGVKNSYLHNIFSLIIKTEDFSIIGDAEDLDCCFCCGYKTIEERANYDICPVCYWEDDGNEDKDQVSSVNRMTLSQGKINFKKYGVYDLRLIENIDKEGKVKYHKCPS